MRFINDDISLKHDERVVPYYNSGIGLLKQIERRQADLGFESEVLYDFADADRLAQKAMKFLLSKDPMLSNDNVFGINVENFMCNFYNKNKNDIGDASDLIGVHTLDNGFTFYGFVAGGDGQRSVFAIIYADEDHLRLYTPRWGNKINIHRQEPLMNDSRSEKYMKKYGLDKSTIGFNWNAIKIDILANIHVDYSNVVQSHLQVINSEMGE